MENKIIERLVQVGIVTAVDTSNKKARVLFQATKITSDWLFVVQHTNEGVNTTIAEGGDPSHTHTATSSVTNWMPTIGQKVIVLYLPIFNSDGFILGCI